MNKLSRILAAIAMVLVLGAQHLLFAHDEPGVGAEVALARLKAGNMRFVKGERKATDHSAERSALATGQYPYAIVLACSDSRVAPEILFDESLGQLFVIRVAGNVTNPVVLGSIEYAAEHLGAKLLVVLGHESCGAVVAALDGGHLPPNIEAITRKIEPAAKLAKKENSSAIDMNVYEQMKNVLTESEILREMVQKKSLAIAGGVYKLNSGEVSWFEK